MTTDTFNFFCKDSDLLADVSTFTRTINAQMLSYFEKHSSNDWLIAGILEDDDKYKCYDC